MYSCTSAIATYTCSRMHLYMKCVHTYIHTPTHIHSMHSMHIHRYTHVCAPLYTNSYIYIVFCVGRSKGRTVHITTMLCEVGSYRTVVGYSYRTLE